MPFLRSRAELLDDLRRQPQVSVLIVGAGINGSAVFRELACQKVDALLIDRGDYCTGTSAASSNLIHGGLRYLEYGELRLVREAIQERNRLLKNAAHYVKPLPTRMPLFSRSSGLLNAPLHWLRIPRTPRSRGAWVVQLGLFLYDAYSRTVVSDLPASSLETRSRSLARFPALNPAIRSTAQYYEAVMLNPERLALQLVQEGEYRHPACRALNYLHLQSIGAAGVTLEDPAGGETFQIKPRLIVNAAGPWIDRVNGRLGLDTGYIGGTKGSHLVLDHPELFAALQGHMFFFENKDGRIVLMYPWHHRVLIGTTDIPVQHPDRAVCTPQEESYLLAMIPHVFPALTATSQHVVFRYSGVRPLGAAAGPAAAISRDHELQFDPPAQGRPPMYSLVGGKWTSFRAFAEQTVNVLLQDLHRPRRAITSEMPIGVPMDDATDTSALAMGLSSDNYRSLRRRYGEIPGAMAQLFAGKANPDLSLSGTGHLRAELEFLCTHERVVHLDDLLLRRAQLAKLGLLTSRSFREVADLVADSLHWSAARKQQERDRCLRLLQERHGLDLTQG